jgi:1-acyl-sn-glycerol-3-phosphate acyltransferase
LKFFFRVLYHILCSIKLVGMENIPPPGPIMIAMNHISLFDAPFAVAFWPYPPEAMGAVDILDRPGQRQLVLAYKGLHVQRDQYDRSVLESAIHVIRSGYPLLIAPEGGRSHDVGMRQAHAGVAYLIDKTNVPVIPVGCVGTTDDMLERALRAERPRLELRVGKPFHLPPIEGSAKERRETRKRNADLVMLKIAELLPPEYHGYYAGKVEGTPFYPNAKK